MINKSGIDMTQTVNMNEPFSPTALASQFLYYGKHTQKKTIVWMLSFGEGINSPEFGS